MTDIANPNKGRMNEAADTSRQILTAARDKVAGAANYVTDQSKQVAAAASEKMANAASYAEQQTEKATDALSGGLKSVARSIRENGPQEGVLGDAACGVAQTFSNAAGYLDEEGLNSIGKDIATVVKKNPIPSIMLGIGLGFLLTRAMSSRT